jgi:hypothetical protein
LIIPLIIQTIGRHPSAPDQIDASPNVSSPFPSSSVQLDAERLPRNRMLSPNAGTGPACVVRGVDADAWRS